MNLKQRIRELVEESLEGRRGRARRARRRERRQQRRGEKRGDDRRTAEPVRVPDVDEAAPSTALVPMRRGQARSDEDDRDDRDGQDADEPDADATEGWGPDVGLGDDLQVRARSGTRAGCVPVRDGLYLVGAIPEEVADDVGVLPLLAPLMRRSASRALRHQDPVSEDERRGLLRNVLHRSRKVATRADANGAVELEVPNVGFAGSDDVADLLGCPCTMRRP